MNDRAEIIGIEMAEKVRGIIETIRDEAEELLFSDPKRLAAGAFGPGTDCLYICMPGVDCRNASGVPALTVEVRDLMTMEVVYTHDPVQDIVNCYDCNPPEAVEKLEAAIATLEAGIKRLRDEALRLKAQP